MTDWLGAALLTAVTLALIVTAWEVASRLFRDDSHLQRGAHACVIALTLVTAAGTALGAMNLLTPAAYLGVVAAAVGAFWLLRALGRLPPRARTATGPGRAAGGPGLIALAAWAGVAAGLVATSGLGSFPTDWDALWYHIPLVDHWLQAGSLYAPDDSYWFMPGNGELVTLWLVGPFSGDFLAPLTDLPALLLFAAAAVELGAALGLSRPLALLAGLVAVTHPVAVAQLLGVGNDLPVVAFFLAAVWYGMRHAESGGRADLALHAACVGMVAGVKYYGLGYAALAGGVTALLTLERRGAGAAVRAAVVAAAGVLVLAGYWFARNAVVTGSPFYPKGFAGGEDILSRKIAGDVWPTTFLGNDHPDLLRLTADAALRLLGPGVGAAAVLAPLTIAWLLASGLRDRGAAGSRRLALVVLTVGAGFLLSVTPLAVEDEPGTLNALRVGYHPCRFGLILASLAVLGLAAVVQDAARLAALRSNNGTAWPALVPATLFAALLAVQVARTARAVDGAAWADAGLMAAGIVATAAAVGLGFAHLPARVRATYAAAVLLATLAAAGWAAAGLADRWHRGFARHYDDMFETRAFSRLEAADPASVRVGFHGYRGYPFFGSRRQFRVCHPYFAPDGNWLTHYFGDRRVTFVAVRKDPDASPEKGQYFWWFDECLAAHPDCFRRAWEGNDFTVFRVVEGCQD
jgi:hypothetical protein